MHFEENQYSRKRPYVEFKISIFQNLLQMNGMSCVHLLGTGETPSCPVRCGQKIITIFGLNRPLDLQDDIFSLTNVKFLHVLVNCESLRKNTSFELDLVEREKT